MSSIFDRTIKYLYHEIFRHRSSLLVAYSVFCVLIYSCTNLPDCASEDAKSKVFELIRQDENVRHDIWYNTNFTEQLPASITVPFWILAKNQPSTDSLINNAEMELQSIRISAKSPELEKVNADADLFVRFNNKHGDNIEIPYKISYSVQITEDEVVYVTLNNVK